MVFRDLPNGHDGSLQILRNLFADIADAEAFADDERVRNRIRLMTRETTRYNWTTSDTVGGIDLFLEDGITGVVDFEFEDEQPNAENFMRSASEALPLTVGRPRRGLKPYVGAVRPVGL